MHPNDFRSIWKLAHLWEGADPDKTDPAKLPEPVVDKLQKLIWEPCESSSACDGRRGWLVQQDDDFFFLINTNRTRVKLQGLPDQDHEAVERPARPLP